jgi:hypothetical protein
LQVFNFPFNSASHVATDEFLSRNDLQSYLLICGTMHSKLHLPKGTFSECPNYVVGTDSLLGFLWSGLDRLLLLSLRSATRVSIGSLILRAAIIGGCERYGELLIIVALIPVWHHRHGNVGGVVDWALEFGD